MIGIIKKLRKNQSKSIMKIAIRKDEWIEKTSDRLVKFSGLARKDIIGYLTVVYPGAKLLVLKEPTLYLDETYDIDKRKYLWRALF
eukprot:UN18104